MSLFERRTALRAAQPGQALVALGGVAFLVDIADISAGGACLKRPRSWSFNIGDSVLIYHLGGVGPALAAQARILWFRDDEIGVQYLGRP